MTDSKENKNTWGGAREGAGAKPLPPEQKGIRINIYAPKELEPQIKEAAEKIKEKYYKKLKRV